MTSLVPEPTELTRARTSPYQIFMLGLCIYALGALAAQTLFALDPATLEILDLVDIAVCGVFILDFIRNVATDLIPSTLRPFLEFSSFEQSRFKGSGHPPPSEFLAHCS